MIAKLLTLGAIALVLSAAWRFVLRVSRWPTFAAATRQEALRLLEQRYARGAISQAQYEAQRRALLER